MAYLKTQTKLLILIALVICAFFGGLVLLYHSSEEEALLQLEDKARERTALLGELVDSYGEALKTYDFDYSYWDEMVSFVKTGDSVWGRVNILEGLKTYNVNVAWVFKTNGAKVYGAASPGMEALLQDSALENRCRQAVSQKPFNHFFARTSFGLLEIRTAPIQPSDDTDRLTPPKGFFVSGFILNDNYTARLNRTLQAKVFIATQPSNFSLGDSLINLNSEGTFSFTCKLPDLDGKPVGALICRAESPLYVSIRSADHARMLYSAIFCVGIMLILSFALYRWVSLPLRQVTRNLQMDNPSQLHPSKVSGKEFKLLGELISAYHEQKARLKSEIEEHQRSQAALGTSEGRFQDIALSLADWIWEVDREGHYTYVSEKTKQILGYEPEEMIGKTPFDLMPAEEAIRIGKIFGKIAGEKKAIIDLENWNLTKSGQKICLLTNGVPILGANGELLGYRGVDKDITKRINSDRILKIFSDAVEGANDGFLMSDLRGQINYVNKSIEKYFGYSREELVGKPIDILSKNPEEAKDIFKTVRDEGKWDGEVLSIRKDGTTFLAALSVSFVKTQDDIPIGTMGILRDITERKMAEEELERSEKKLSLIFDAAGDVIFMIALVDGRYRFETVNHTFEHVTGLPKSLVEGKYVEEVIPEPSLSIALNNYNKAIREQEIVRWEEVSDYPTGTLTGIVTVAPILDERGECTQLVGTVHNITERKRAEEALQKSREVLQAILNSIPMRVFWKDRNLLYLGGNTPFARDAGFEKPEDIIGKDDYAMGWREQAELYRADDRKVIESGNAKLNIEEPQTTPSGEQIHLLTSKVPLRDADGTIIGVLGTYLDITERKRAEEALANESIRRQILIEGSRDGIVVLDDNGKVCEANPKYAEMLGYTPEEILKLHVWDWDFQWTRDQLLEMIRNVGPAGDHFETRHRRKDDSLIDVEISSNGAMCGGQKLVFCVCRDISERKRAEEALRESEVKYRTVIENMQDVFYRTDLQGNLIMISPSGAQHLGYKSIDQLIGQNVANVFYAYSEDRASLLHELQAKGAVRDYEVALRRTDGTIFFASVNCHFYYDSTGKLLGVEGILHDINERKKNLEALRASEERYRLLIENASEAIFVIQDFKISFSNEKLAEILGYKNEDVIDKNFTDYIHPDERDIVVNRFKARVEGMQVGKAAPFRVLACDGSYKWLEVDAVKLLWNGKPATLNFATDITERIIAQNDLKESEVKFRTIFEHSSEAAFLLIDKFIDCNQMACELLGYKREEIIGFSPADYSPEIQPDGRSSAEAAAKYDSAAFAGTPQKFYWQHKRKNGSLIDTEVSLTSLTVDGRLMIHAVIRDISQRKRAEETLRRLATAVEQSADGIVIMNTQGVIEYVNPAFEKITGRARDEVTGLMPSFLDPQNQGSIQSREIWAKLKIGRSWSGTLIGHKKDGTLINEEITISPVFDSLGTIINFIAVKRDITRQTALEQQLLQSQKMEAIGRLAGGVAHDFNNLLSVIIGYSEILYRKLSGQDSLRSDIEEIRKAGERAASLTRQLLAFSRKQIIQPKVLNLNSVVTDMNKMLRRLIGENIALTVEIEPRLWAVKADPGQIEQIVMNLAVNARDAMPDGGKLVIKTANAPSVNKNNEEKPILGESVILTVSDNGTGIPEDIRAHIFEPFFTTKEQGQGTGLGLSTVYGIVQQNHGHIEVESKVGLGTSFIIYLPKHSEEADKTGKIETQSILCSRSETILVVEDEEIVRTLTCRILGELGYRAIAFDRPIEAVDACLKSDDHIDLVLTDIVMPEMNGDELSRRIKESNPDMKILFMSGYTDNAFISHEILESQADFIQKPFKRDVLAMKVREVLDRKGAINECLE